MTDLIFKTRQVSPRSLQQYTTVYENILIAANEIGNFSFLNDASEERIVEVINSMQSGKNLHRLRMTFNVAAMIRKMLNKPADILSAKCLELHNEYLDRVPIENKRKRNEVYPTKPDFEAWIEAIENPVSYIVNKLMYAYSLRNADLNVHLFGPEENVPLSIGNYLRLLPDKKAFLFISNYKTAKSYGPKEFLIEDEPKLIGCIEFVVILRKMKVLFPISYGLNKGEKGPDQSLSFKMKKYLYPGLTEGDYLKIRIGNFAGQASEELLEISKRRGTSVDTLLKCYC